MPSFHPRRFGLIGAIGLALSLMLMAGCNSKDDPAAPNNTVELTGAQAEDWTMQVLEMINGMSVNVDDWATGEFTGLNMVGANKAPEEPSFDEGSMAWTLHFEGPVGEVAAPDYFNATMDYYLQFRDGAGQPVMLPEHAASYVARVALGFDLHSEQEGNVSDMDYEFITELEVSGLHTDTYGVNGSGSSAVEARATSSEGTARMDFAMAWGMDLTVPAAGGCPSGAAEVNATNFEMHAVYDGQGNADWTLTGPGYEASGTELMECGQPQ
jgi:hypothetical protein